MPRNQLDTSHPTPANRFRVMRGVSFEIVAVLFEYSRPYIYVSYVL